MFASEADVLAYVKTNPIAVSPVLLCGPKSLKEASRVHDVEGGDDNQAKDSGAAFVIESDEGQVDNCDENTYCGNSVETPRTRRLSREVPKPLKLDFGTPIIGRAFTTALRDADAQLTILRTKLPVMRS